MPTRLIAPAGEFQLGANLPWVRYGTDVGRNAWHPEGGIGVHPDPARLVDLLVVLREHGFDCVRWFLLCDGRAGIRFDADGTPLGVDSAAWRDLDAILRLVDRARLRLLPVLLDFHWCRPASRVNGVTLAGHRTTIAHPRRRAALVRAVLSPLAARYGQEPLVYAWDLINEPEWATFGLGTWQPFAVTAGSMRRFVRDATAAVHAVARQPVTVGSASARWLGLVRGLGLDLYQVHWYEPLERRAPLARPVAALACDRPVLLGEFPTAGSTRAPEAIVAAARNAGYAGAFFWSVLADDQATLPRS